MPMLPDFPELPPRQQEMVICAIGAGLAYGVPVNIMLAVAEQEGGRPGQWQRNADGTHDVGALQFNTGYLRTLRRHGITAQAVSEPGCYPYQLAAWRLRGHLRGDRGDLWTRAANYHSRTPRHNARYRGELMRKGWQWSRWLSRQFITHKLDGVTAHRHDETGAIGVPDRGDAE